MKHGTGCLRKWPGRRDAPDRAAIAMTAIDSTRASGHESTERNRVTAKMRRRPDGTVTCLYRADGEVYTSLGELKAALEGRR